MQKEQIVVGRSYVNEEACIVREVVEEINEHEVKLNAFDLSTGKLIATRHRVWNKTQLARWADREASAPEAARVHPYQAALGVDMSVRPVRAGSSPESARAARDDIPGHHIFPVGK